MTFPTKRFVESVVRLAEENPDFVYGCPKVWHDELQDYIATYSCVYVERDPDTGERRGSCLIGQALLEVGVITTCSLSDQENYTSIFLLNNDLALGIPDEVLAWAQVVQSSQDAQASWGSALERADRANGRPVV